MNIKIFQMISVVVLAYNEELRISSCLDSLLDFPEVIVVDMDSKDNTRELAIAKGAKVVTVNAQAKFDILRQKGIDESTYNWILFVDADELITRSLSSYILNVVQNSNASVYMIPRLNYVFGHQMQGCGYWPDYQIKLFKKGSVVLSDEVHDFIQIEKGMKVELFPRMEQYAIQHFTNNSIYDFVCKMNNYTEIATKDEKQNKSALFLFVKRFLFRYFRAKGFLSNIGSDFSVMLAIYDVVLMMKAKYPTVDYHSQKSEIIEDYKK